MLNITTRIIIFNFSMFLLTFNALKQVLWVGIWVIIYCRESTRTGNKERNFNRVNSNSRINKNLREKKLKVYRNGSGKFIKEDVIKT